MGVSRSETRGLVTTPIILLLVTIPLLLNLSLVNAFPSGSITIVSYPSEVPVSYRGLPPAFNVVTHEKWSGLVGSGSQSISVTLPLTQLYIPGGMCGGVCSNSVSITATCVSGCQSTAHSGQLNATFTLTSELLYPDPSSSYVYPILTYSAQIAVCLSNTDCTTLDTSDQAATGFNYPSTTTTQVSQESATYTSHAYSSVPNVTTPTPPPQMPQPPKLTYSTRRADLRKPNVRG